jgi:hypothetical protein
MNNQSFLSKNVEFLLFELKKKLFKTSFQVKAGFERQLLYLHLTYHQYSIFSFKLNQVRTISLSLTLSVMAVTSYPSEAPFFHSRVGSWPHPQTSD